MPDVSDDAVRRATGHGWDHWFRVLDEAGSTDHPARALHLGRLGVPDWWCQMVAVEYEKERGLRVKGQTSTGDFQASAQRKFPLDADAAWEAVLAAPWLGRAVRTAWEEGATFTGPEGERVEVRAVRPATLLRFWRHLPGGRTTVEVALRAEAGGTAVRFMETGVPTPERNEAAKARWRQALDVVAAASGATPSEGRAGKRPKPAPRAAAKPARSVPKGNPATAAKAEAAKAAKSDKNAARPVARGKE